MHSSAPVRIPSPPVQIPPAWIWLFDEAIPSWVKSQYSPMESWKTKPFSEEDARFFSRGIHELSELFTDERPAKLPSYFHHPRFRSAYLLYFLPLQAAKFVSVYQLHAPAIHAALAHARRTGALSVADLGAGPGTASLGLVLFLLSQATQSRDPAYAELPPIRLHLVDTNSDILQDGKALIEQLSSHFPRLRGKVTVVTHIGPWWKTRDLFASEPSGFSLTLLGHVLNESSPPEQTGPAFWAQLLQRSSGGTLVVEPASRRSSQLLSRLRDRLLEEGVLPKRSESIWGPCLHAQSCPLAEGRDWCHFSIPAQIPGKWFKAFSKSLGSEKQWLKFSYLWLASSEAPAPRPEPGLLRVVSDPLGQNRGKSAVLICEPERPGRLEIPKSSPIQRGDLVRMK